MIARQFRLTGIDHVVIRAQDIDRMLAFYCGALGCEIERGPLPSGLIQLRAGTALIDLVDGDGRIGRLGGAAPGAEGHNMDHLCVGVRPFDEAQLRAHLAAHGATVIDSGVNYGAEGDGTFLYLHDPEGNSLTMFTWSDPSRNGRFSNGRR